MACCGDWLGCCSLEHGWDGFGESGFHVGSGSERTAEAITLSSVGSPPLATGFNSSYPSSESHVVTELVRPRQGRENSKGSELEASPDPAWPPGWRREGGRGLRQEGSRTEAAYVSFFPWPLPQPPLFCGFPANPSFCLMQRDVLPLVPLLSWWEPSMYFPPHTLC